MAKSAWYIWLHPVRTRRTVDELTALTAEDAELREELETLRETLCGTNSQLSEKTSEVHILREEKDALAASHCELEKEKAVLEERVEELERELDRSSRELSRRVDAETQIREFEAKLGGIESLKAQYELRIRRLRDEIRNLRKQSGQQQPGSEELREIDMNTGRFNEETTRKSVVSAGSRQPSSVANDDADWLQDLTI